MPDFRIAAEILAAVDVVSTIADERSWPQAVGCMLAALREEADKQLAEDTAIGSAFYRGLCDPDWSNHAKVGAHIRVAVERAGGHIVFTSQGGGENDAAAPEHAPHGAMVVNA